MTERATTDPRVGAGFGTGAADRGTDVTAAASRGSASPRETELGGDPACWLNRVCDACGRFIDDPFAEVCPACGARRDAAR